MDLVLGIVEPLPQVDDGGRRFLRIRTEHAEIGGSDILTKEEPPLPDNIYAHVVGLEINTGDGCLYNVHMEQRHTSRSNPRYHITMNRYDTFRRTGWLEFEKPDEWCFSDVPQVPLMRKHLPDSSEIALAFLGPGREGPRYIKFGCVTRAKGWLPANYLDMGSYFELKLRLTAIRISGIESAFYRFEAHDAGNKLFHGAVGNSDAWLSPGKWMTHKSD